MGKIYQLVKEIRIVRMMLFSLILNYRVAEIFNVMILLIGFIIYYSVYDSLLLIGTWKLNKTINKNGFCLYLSENLFKFAISFGILLFLHSSIKIREISDIENMGN